MEQEEPGIPIEAVIRDEDCAAERDGVENSAVRAVAALEPDPNYAFEPELLVATPRPIPAALTKGPLLHRRMTVKVAMLTAGLFIVCFWLIPWPTYMTSAFLLWPAVPFFGGAVVLLGLCIPLRSSPYRGEMDHFRLGEPIAARVVGLIGRPEAFMMGDPAMYGFAALVNARFSSGADLMTIEVKSRPMNAGEFLRSRTTTRLEDTVTLLRHPATKHIVMYEWLGLQSGKGIVADHQLSGWRLALPTAMRTLAVCVLVMLVMVVALGFSRFWPIDLPTSQAWAVAGFSAAVIGVPAMVIFVRHEHDTQRLILEQNLRSVAENTAPKVRPLSQLFRPELRYRALQAFAVFATLGVSAGVGMMVVFGLNATFDRSITLERRAIAVRSSVLTHWGVFRSTTLEFEWADTGKKASVTSSEPEVNALSSPYLIVETGQGRFGWPYIRRIRSMEP